MQAQAPPKKADPEAARKIIGALLYVLGVGSGALLLLLIFILPAFASRSADQELEAMALGALFAMPMLVIYLWIPWIVDRYDPEPWWCLLLVLVWGAIASCGISGLVNTLVAAFATAITGDERVGDVLGACVSAPLIEELTKGMAVFGMYFFVRRQFDGVVDGVIYATFAALGFAAVENVIYYGNAYKADTLGPTFIVRGILAPWGHPLYTSMIGLGFGLARETTKGWVKFFAPIGGFLFAAFLHSVWNTAATLSNSLVLLMLPLWLLFVLAFMILVLWLVSRKGKIIGDHLKDEILMGNLTPYELDLVTSPVGRIRATFSYGGAAGRRFIDAAARLALSKWHTGRATQGRKLTVSADMIFPLRQDLHRLRAEVARALGRPVPQPQAWTPGAPMPGSPHAPPHGHAYGPPGTRR